MPPRTRATSRASPSIIAQHQRRSRHARGPPPPRQAAAWAVATTCALQRAKPGSPGLGVSAAPDASAVRRRRQPMPYQAAIASASARRRIGHGGAGGDGGHIVAGRVEIAPGPAPAPVRRPGAGEPPARARTGALRRRFISPMAAPLASNARASPRACRRRDSGLGASRAEPSGRKAPAHEVVGGSPHTAAGMRAQRPAGQRRLASDAPPPPPRCAASACCVAVTGHHQTVARSVRRSRPSRRRKAAMARGLHPQRRRCGPSLLPGRAGTAARRRKDSPRPVPASNRLRRIRGDSSSIGPGDYSWRRRGIIVRAAACFAAPVRGQRKRGGRKITQRSG